MYLHTHTYLHCICKESKENEEDGEREEERAKGQVDKGDREGNRLKWALHISFPCP